MFDRIRRWFTLPFTNAARLERMERIDLATLERLASMATSTEMFTVSMKRMDENKALVLPLLAALQTLNKDKEAAIEAAVQAAVAPLQAQIEGLHALLSQAADALAAMNKPPAAPVVSAPAPVGSITVATPKQ